MTERLALPGWKTPPTSLEAWTGAIAALGHRVETERESTGASWIEVPSVRVRGYVLMQGQFVEAINFETSAADPAPVLDLIGQAAAALGWELHDDDGEDEDDRD